MRNEGSITASNIQRNFTERLVQAILVIVKGMTMSLIILLWVAIFIAAFALMYFVADKFIDYLKDLSRLLKISPLLVGLVILGIDPEETIASVIGAINGLPYIAVGNVIGNSIIAISLCFALPALFCTITLDSIPKFYPLLMIGGVVVILLGFPFPYNLLFTGIMNFSLFWIYLIKNLKKYKKSKQVDIIIRNEEEEEEGTKRENHQESEENRSEDRNKGRIIGMAILFLSIIVVGGELLVHSTENLIKLSGIEEAFFGFIIIAFATNAEEITLILKSIQKGEQNIGIGGMIGKLIWNIGFTFGLSGIILVRTGFQMSVIYNSLILLGLLCYFYFALSKKTLERGDGMVFFVGFGLFLVVNFLLI